MMDVEKEWAELWQEIESNGRKQQSWRARFFWLIWRDPLQELLRESFLSGYVLGLNISMGDLHQAYQTGAVDRVSATFLNDRLGERMREMNT
jgi:hypothetical protein